MKHASTPALESISLLLDRIRALDQLTERKLGTFYRGSSAFLHFHEDAAGMFADVKLDLAKFTRFAVNTNAEQDQLVKLAAQALSAAKERKGGVR